MKNLIIAFLLLSFAASGQVYIGKTVSKTITYQEFVGKQLKEQPVDLVGKPVTTFVLQDSVAYSFTKEAGYTYTVNITRSGGTIPPDPIPTVPVVPGVIEAESAVQVTNATKEATQISGMANGAVIKYTLNFTKATTKLTVNYSRGNLGTGLLYVRVGSPTAIASATLQLPYTALTVGTWTRYLDFTVNLSVPAGVKDIYITSSSLGPANLNSLKFE